MKLFWLHRVPTLLQKQKCQWENATALKYKARWIADASAEWCLIVFMCVIAVCVCFFFACMWVSEAVWWDKWELWWILGRGGHSWEQLQAAGMLSSLLLFFHPQTWKHVISCVESCSCSPVMCGKGGLCVSEGERESVYSELLVLFMRSAGLEECECLLSRLTSLGKREGRRPADAHAHTHTHPCPFR